MTNKEFLMDDITIIMPSYNKEKYISKVLDSVFMQETTYAYKIIIVDDCSTDKTVDIVKDYQKKNPNKIILLTSEKNQKLYRNILRAYELTKTDYFSVLDPDDFWTDKKKIQKALDFLESNKEYTLYCGNTEINGSPYCQVSHSYNFDFYDYLEGRASFGHTSSTIFRNVIFKYGVPYKMKNLTTPTQERTFRGDSFRNLIHLYEGNGHFEPYIDSVYRITSEGIWTSLSRPEQLLLNANLFKDMYLYFNKDYPELLYKSYQMLDDIRAWILKDTPNKTSLLQELESVEELCNGVEFQKYLHHEKKLEAQNAVESELVTAPVNNKQEVQISSKKNLSIKGRIKEKVKRIINRTIGFLFEQEKMKVIYESSRYSKDIYETSQSIYKAIHRNLDVIHDFTEENYWANVFNSTIAESDFLTYKAFCPGRWGASYSFLYVLYRVLDEFRPHNILEFGLGQTSKISIQYANKYNENLTIIEHNPEWLDAFKKNVPIDFAVEKYVNILGLKEKDNGTGYVYAGFEDFLSKQKHKFDLVVVDGPFGSKHNSRVEILKILNVNMLNGNFVILVNDCDRLAEQETIQTIQTILISKNIKFFVGEYKGEKKQVLITNIKNRFLTSL